MGTMVRSRLPQASDRRELGRSGLKVGPLCLGITTDPDTVVAAYEHGVNFFFLSADLHWPLYEGTRKGLAKLLEGNPSRRDEIVIAAVSYLAEPLFGAFQFHEVINAVSGLKRIDVVIAGAVSDDNMFYPRLEAIEQARSITEKLNKSADRVDSVLKAAESFLGSASGETGKSAFDEVREAARSIRELAQHLDERTAELTSGFGRLTTSGLRQVEALSEEGRRTLTDIGRAVRNFDRNPSQVLFGSRPQIPEYNGRR